MKTFIWKLFFRCGWNAKSATYNGWNAKHDAKTTRTRLKRLMNKLLSE